MPDPTTRKDCAVVLRNYEFAADDPRRISIKTWREKLSLNERHRLNHPARSGGAGWLADTEPEAEKAARKAEGEARTPKTDPKLDLIQDIELERDAARRDSQALRELLARVRDEYGGQLSPAMLDAIAEALQ